MQSLFDKTSLAPVFLAIALTACGDSGGGGGNPNGNPGGNTGRSTSEVEIDGAPQVLDSTGDNTGYPSIAVGNDGVAVVAWSEWNETTSDALPFGTSRVVARVYQPQSGWQAQIVLGEGGFGLSTPQAKVITDRLGNFMVVWHQAGSSVATFKSKIYSRRYRSADDSWTPADILNDGSVASTLPDAAMDTAGNAIAAWTESNSGEFAAVFSAQSGAWSTAARIPGAPQAPTAATRIAMDAQGSGAVLWTDTMGTAVMSSIFDGGAFQQATALAQPASGGFGPEDFAVAKTSAGEAWAVYIDVTHIQARRYNGTTWETAVSLGEAAITGGYPVMAVDALGTPLLAIETRVQTGNSTSNDISVFSYSAGTWSSYLPETDSHVAVRPVLAVNGANRSLVLWHQAVDHSFIELQARSYDSGNWSNTLMQVRNDNDADINFQQIGLDNGNAATVVYVQNRDIIAQHFVVQ